MSFLTHLYIKYDIHVSASYDCQGISSRKIEVSFNPGNVTLDLRHIFEENGEHITDYTLKSPESLQENLGRNDLYFCDTDEWVSIPISTEDLLQADSLYLIPFGRYHKVTGEVFYDQQTALQSHRGDEPVYEYRLCRDVVNMYATLELVTRIIPVTVSFPIIGKTIPTYMSEQGHLRKYIPHPSDDETAFQDRVNMIKEYTEQEAQAKALKEIEKKRHEEEVEIKRKEDEEKRSLLERLSSLSLEELKRVTY